MAVHSYCQCGGKKVENSVPLNPELKISTLTPAQPPTPAAMNPLIVNSQLISQDLLTGTGKVSLSLTTTTKQEEEVSKKDEGPGKIINR